MSLLLQLNGDLPSNFPDDERRLHIFSCRKKACSRKRGSIRALREVKKYKALRRASAQPKDKVPVTSQEKKPPQDLGAALFGAAPTPPGSNNTNPFSTSSPPQNTTNPFASFPPTSTLAAKPPQPPSEPPTETFASKLNISTPSNPPPPTEPWPEASSLPLPYPSFHLDADYEALTPTSDPTVSSTEVASSSSSKPQYDIDDTPSSGGIEKDTFESTLDTTFLKFSDRLSQNPGQVLRYEFSGTPLLYSGTDSTSARFGVGRGEPKIGAAQGIPRCENCGSKRVYELQLVPGLISALEEDEVDIEAGMEWGTVVLGVCASNCAGEKVGEVVYREEWVGVQWEERLVGK